METFGQRQLVFFFRRQNERRRQELGLDFWLITEPLIYGLSVRVERAIQNP
jgi:hypothetical protein